MAKSVRVKIPTVRSILGSCQIAGRNLRGRLLINSPTKASEPALLPVLSNALVAKKTKLVTKKSRTSSPPAASASSTSKATAHSEQLCSQPVLALRSYIVERYATGDLYGTDVAELAWHLTQCDLPFDDLALNPNEPSFAANANRKVQRSLGFGSIQEEFSTIQLPTSCLESGTRVWKDLECFSVAEALSQEFKSRPEQIIETLSCFNTQNWQENRHRQAGEAEGDINVPCGIFIDGAAWAGKGAGTRESVVAMYVNILGEFGP